MPTDSGRASSTPPSTAGGGSPGGGAGGVAEGVAGSDRLLAKSDVAVKQEPWQCLIQRGEAPLAKSSYARLSLS